MMRLILFDIDGTLVLDARRGREATQYAMIEVFGTCGALAAHKFGGKTDWQTLSELLHEVGVSYDDIERADARLRRRDGTAACARSSISMTCSPAPARSSWSSRSTNATTWAWDWSRATCRAPRRSSCARPGSILISFRSARMAARRWSAIISRRWRSRGRPEHYRYPFAPQDVLVVGDTLADIDLRAGAWRVAVAVQTGFSAGRTGRCRLSAARFDRVFARLP